MEYQSGELYFIREREATGFTPYVKVGLVRYAERRDSFNRLFEHQTGNPRTLYLDPSLIIKTQAVDMVEAQMHRIFASKRVSGEWFQFDSDAELSEAMHQAAALSKDAEERVKLFAYAATLSKQESNGGSITASLELGEKAEALAVAKEKSRLCGALLDEIRNKMVFAYKAGADVSGVAKTTIRTFKPRLDKDALEAAQPAIYNQFLVTVVKFRGSFLLKIKGAELVLNDQEFMRELKELEAIINSVKDHRDIARLNEPTLALTRMKGLADWDAEVLQAELQVAMANAEAIDGVCTWKRGEATSTVFDEAAFAEAHPDLAKQFMVVAEPKTYVAPAKKKAN